jgi:hypothetical protein
MKRILLLSSFALMLPAQGYTRMNDTRFVLHSIKDYLTSPTNYYGRKFNCNWDEDSHALYLAIAIAKCEASKKADGYAISNEVSLNCNQLRDYIGKTLLNSKNLPADTAARLEQSMINIAISQDL